MKYHETEPMDRMEASKAFQSGDTSAVCEALVRTAFYEPDWEWVQNQCLEFIRYSTDVDVKKISVLCLGHAARVNGVIDLSIVLPLLNKLLDDPELTGYAENALGDIDMYVLHKYE